MSRAPTPPAASPKIKKLVDRAQEAERQLAFMNDEYAKLKAKHDALEPPALESKALGEKAKKLERDVESAGHDVKAEIEYRKKIEKARDEWKSFATALALQMLAIESVAKDAPGDQAAAVRQLVIAAKKLPHPAVDPVHPDMWKWVVLGGLGVLGCYFGLRGAWGVKDGGATAAGESGKGSAPVCAAPASAP